MANTLRKNSGRYRLMFINEKWKKEIVIGCDTLTGKILPVKEQKVLGTDLPILDRYILENFKDEESLRLFVRNLGYSVTEDDIPKFAYQHNGMTNYLDLMYQNSKLYDFSVLFAICKQKNIRANNFMSNTARRSLRQIISDEIVKEPLWQKFYTDFIDQIHEPNFYTYLTEKMILGDRATGFITDYLNNEHCITNTQNEAFSSAKYYLADTFTAYKPIRGAIIARINYLSKLTQPPLQVCTIISPKSKLKNSFVKINPWELLTEEQLLYLESHKSFFSMSTSEQENMLVSLLGFTEIPWHERTLQTLSVEQIDYLEDHPYFSNLSYVEKIEFVDRLCQKEETPTSYQKKKIQ